MIELECLPYGVCHANEGVCLLVRMGPHRILLDCGIADISALVSEPNRLPADVVLCSHAHEDHARGLLALHEKFPQLPIYASEVTSQLLPLNWPNVDAAEVARFCQALPWRSPVEFREGLCAELFPAGHLPGAAAILLTYSGSQRPGESMARPYTLLYTGDFFLSNSRLVEGLPLEELRGLEPDVLIIEGSYGTARYPHRRQQENQLAERIHRAIAQQTSVVLVTPTVGLGQELLMLLRSHHHFTGRDMDIWVNGTVAAGCDAYLELLAHFPTSVQNFARHQSLFWDERVRPRVRRFNPEERELLTQSICVVITDNTEDLNNCFTPESGSWLVLLPEHPGHPVMPDPALLEIAERSPVSIESYLLSQHCDGPGTTQLIHNLRPQHVIFVHGSPTYLADLTNLDELRNRYQLHCPSAGTLVELPIGETFLQPEVTETHYEGELTEGGTVVTITLPSAIASDPRWPNFADTGLVEVRWQGEELVLRGLSQRELLTQTSDRPVPPDLECCFNCQHYRGQRCWNQASPLLGFKVTPDGWCLAFEPGQTAIHSTDMDEDLEEED